MYDTCGICCFFLIILAFIIFVRFSEGAKGKNRNGRQAGTASAGRPPHPSPARRGESGSGSDFRNRREKLLKCPTCGLKAVYSEEEKAYVCRHCDRYLWVLIKCPGCRMTVRVTRQDRPYSFSCPKCEMKLTLDTESRLRSAPRRPATVSREHERKPDTEESLAKKGPVCQDCKSPLEPHWWSCPFCGYETRTPSEYTTGRVCVNCTLPVEAGWSFCPFCSSVLEKEAAVMTERTDTEPEPRPSQEDEPVLLGDEEPITGIGASMERTREVGGSGIKKYLEGGHEEDVCPGCGKQIEETWLVCQYCMFGLKQRDEKEHCPHCDRIIEPGRMLCPFCASDLTDHEGREDEDKVSSYPEHAVPEVSREATGGTKSEEVYHEEPQAADWEEEFTYEGQSEVRRIEVTYPHTTVCPHCTKPMRIRRPGKFKCPNCWRIVDIDKYGLFIFGEEQVAPCCPRCHETIQYSKEERDYYCWVCGMYISEM